MECAASVSASQTPTADTDRDAFIPEGVEGRAWRRHLAKQEKPQVSAVGVDIWHSQKEMPDTHVLASGGSG